MSMNLQGWLNTTLKTDLFCMDKYLLYFLYKLWCTQTHFLVPTSPTSLIYWQGIHPPGQSTEISKQWKMWQCFSNVFCCLTSYRYVNSFVKQWQGNKTNAEIPRYLCWYCAGMIVSADFFGGKGGRGTLFFMCSFSDISFSCIGFHQD